MPPPTRTITQTLVYCVDPDRRGESLAEVNAMEAEGWRVHTLLPLLEGQGGALVACTTQMIVVYEREI